MNEAEVTASERPTSKRPPKKSSPAKSSKSQPNSDFKAELGIADAAALWSENDCQSQFGDD